ncbi:MAG: cyclic pyranopterin monophosphate synthase MoaC [Deltaproteobacteria bacterium]|nr:cyclic pyranopterin monophosphate synthase MoaC [Deltaproteobacteria bacterium]
MAELTHLDERGRGRMVEVGEKPVTHRVAVACASIAMKPETFYLIQDRKIAKGDVLAVAQVAGIMAAKRTPELIPLCHPLSLTGIDLTFEPVEEEHRIGIRAEVRATDRTGVEMEALTAVAAAALTIYDMCKAVDREMVISDIKLLRKAGGKSGEFVRDA